MNVKVAGGAILSSIEAIQELQWNAQGCTFTERFRVLALDSYDGIIGLDWLVKHSP